MSNDTDWGIGPDPKPLHDADRRLAVAKRRITECGEVNRLTYEKLTTEQIGARLGVTPDKVRTIQQWLGWRRGVVSGAREVKSVGRHEI